MKAFKHYTFSFLLVLISTILFSCANNSGGSDPDDPDPEEPVDLTKENLLGEWEVGYFTKEVGTSAPQRDVLMDGFIIKFKEDNTYTEMNSLGESNAENGRYSIIDDKHIQLVSEVRPNVDTTVVLKIMKLTDKVMLRQNDYKKKNTQGTVEYSIRDIQYLRNTVTAPTENFGQTKGKTVTPEYLKGEWVLDTIYIRKSEDGKDYISVPYDDSKDKSLGNKFTFNTSDGTFVELLNHGTKPENKGVFVIVDDVIHYYYEVISKEKEGQLSEKMAGMRINILPETPNFYQMEDFVRRIVYTNENKFQIQEYRSIFNKKKN